MGMANENRKYSNSDTCTCTHCVARVGCCENPPDFAKMWRFSSLESGEITDGIDLRVVIPVYNNWSDLNFVVEATGG